MADRPAKKRKPEIIVASVIVMRDESNEVSFHNNVTKEDFDDLCRELSNIMAKYGKPINPL